MAVDQVELVKSKADIVQIIGEKVALKKAGRNYKGLCPFHSEKTPSFMVSPERQTFKCFGCGEGGDVITFLQKYDGMSFYEALEALAKRVGVTLESYRPTAQDQKRKRILEAMSLSAEYYHYILTQHKSGEAAREYLKTRGIGSEAIKQFNLGYAPAQWRSVSDFLVGKKKYSAEELEAGGIVIASNNGFYDRFRGRIIFPLKDHKGVVVGFSGRVLNPDEKEAKYINSPETQIYSKSKMLYGLWENREYIRKADAIVLVEGELDVIPSWQAGVKHVVAIKGSAFTDEQAQLIKRFTKNIYMSLDADAAGQEAIKRAVAIAENIDMSIRVVQVSGGKDPGEVATNNPSAWREMVKQSVFYWDFLIQSAISRHDPKTGEGSREIAAEVIPAVAGIGNVVMKAHYVTELAKRLHVPEESIYEEIARVEKRKELTGLKAVVTKIEQGKSVRRDEVAIFTLAMALQNYKELAEEVEKIQPEWFERSAVTKIFTELKKWDKKKPLDIKAFSKGLPEELLPTLDKAYLRDLDEIEVGKEWAKTAKEAEAIYTRERLKNLSDEIAKAEANEKAEELTLLQEEFAKLSKRLAELAQ